MDSVIVFSAMGGDAMSFTKRIIKRRADFWAALGHDGNNGIEELLKLYYKAVHKHGNIQAAYLSDGFW